MGSSHLLASAAIGRSLHPRLWLAVPAAFAFHFVLDAIPHLDTNDLYGAPKGPLVMEVGLAVIDFTTAAVLVGFLVRARPWRRTALWAALSGVVIDLLNTIPPVGPWFATWRWTSWIDRFHHGIQPDVPTEQWLAGFGTQAVVIAVSVWILLRRSGT